MRILWIITGTVATAGMFWLVFRLFGPFEFGVVALVLAALAGGLASGGLIASHVPVRPMREPLVAGVVGVGIMLAALYGVLGGWLWRYVTTTWALVAAPIIGGGASALGAAAVRRLKGVSVTTLSVISLSCAVTVGLVVTLSAVSRGGSPGVLLMLGTIALGAFLTQLVVPVRAVWASAAGIVMVPLTNFLANPAYLAIPTQRSAADLGIALVGALILVLPARLGSQIATRIANKPAMGDVPSAHAR